MSSNLESSGFNDQYKVPSDGRFDINQAPTRPSNIVGKSKVKKQLASVKRNLSRLQRSFYADNRHALLLIFQAMDAAGKDSTIRHVFSGINPAGFQVYSFKQPSKEELDHDFLWRSACRLPERGRIGVFNRSYYEETLVVRVHPEYLQSQRISIPADLDHLWSERFTSIRDHERHLTLNGTTIVKFWLNVSKDEQKRRFLERINNPRKNWKFSEHDINERQHWTAYQAAYEHMIRGTSTDYAPWYAIPADNKPMMRLIVAQIIEKTLISLNCSYPELSPEAKAQLSDMSQRLINESPIG